MSRMPALFIGHGTPMNALEDNIFTRTWQQLNAATPTPTAILCISAHWYTNASCITGNQTPPTIHDFGHFPQALFDIQYPCPGAPALAEQISQAIAAVSVENNWGLDHGSWSILKHVYPKADIPVLQLSIDRSQPASFHFDLGRQLRFLREQNVLIIGSGNIVHNIQKWLHDPHGPIAWAQHFNAKVIQAIIDGDDDALIHYQRWQPEAQDAVPTAEHYLPLLYILGLRHDDDVVRFSNFGEDTLENCSMTSLALAAA